MPAKDPDDRNPSAARFRAPAVVITVNGEPKANRKQQESHEFIGVRTMLEPQRDGRSTELTVPGDLRTSQVRPG